jgi:segregation and condensation protein B
MARQPASNPEPEPQQGISLEELADAFAQVMGKAPRPRTEKSAEPAAHDTRSPRDAGADGSEEIGASSESLPPPGEEEPGEQAIPRQILPASDSSAPTATVAEEDACQISPKSLFEAMLFVGNRENRPLTAGKAAELMRDVAPEEIPAIVDELNAGYESGNRPYHVVAEGDGYRLTLRKAFHPVRNKLYGKIREARLSQAAIDVLALVAYKQPVTGEDVGKLRGKPSSHILAQLVRRGLLRLERPADNPRRPHYFTTERFMRLFNLDSLEDLPRSEEPG